jgi:hypothetical protein
MSQTCVSGSGKVSKASVKESGGFVVATRESPSHSCVDEWVKAGAWYHRPRGGESS